MAFVFEDQHLVRHPGGVEGLAHRGQVLGGDVGVERALDDEEPPLDVADVVHRRALAVALGHLLGASAQHLLRVGAQVGAGAVVVDHQVGHAADGRGRGHQLARGVGDLPPARVAAVGGAGHAHPARLGQPRGHQGLDAGADVVLLEPAPAGLLDLLLERQPVAGRAAVVGQEDVEPPRQVVLHLGVDALAVVRGGAAVDQYDRALGAVRGAVDEAVDAQAVAGGPLEVLGGHQPREQPRRQQRLQFGEALEGLGVGAVGVQPHHVGGAGAGGVDAHPALDVPPQQGQVAARRPHLAHRPALGVGQQGVPASLAHGPGGQQRRTAEAQGMLQVGVFEQHLPPIVRLEPAPDAGVLGLGHVVHPQPRPQPVDLARLAGAHERAVAPTVRAHEPELLAPGVAGAAVVEHPAAVGGELRRPGTRPLGPRQRAQFSGSQVAPPDPGGLDRLAPFEVVVGAEEDPGAFGMQLGPAREVGRVRLADPLGRALPGPRPGGGALVARVGLVDHAALAGEEPQQEGFVSTVAHALHPARGRARPDAGGGVHPVPDPGQRAAAGAQLGRVELREVEQEFEQAFGTGHVSTKVHLLAVGEVVGPSCRLRLRLRSARARVADNSYCQVKKSVSLRSNAGRKRRTIKA